MFLLTLDIPRKEKQVISKPEQSFLMSEWSMEIHYDKWNTAIDLNTNQVHNGSDTEIPDLFFHFFAHCKNAGCGQSFLNTNDLEVNWATKKLEKLGIENEIRVIGDETEEFEFNYHYDVQKLAIVRQEVTDEMDKISRSLYLPIETDFNWGDQKQIMSQLRTLHFYG